MSKSDLPKGQASSRRPRNAVWGRRVLVLGALGAAVAAGCDDPEVRYGPVGGLRVRESGENGGAGPANACGYPEGTDTTGATCPDWATEVFPLFDSAQYACTSNGCHGGNTGAAGLTMPAGDPDASYQAMANYTRDGRPYIGAGLQDEAYLLCNIWRDAPVTVGTLMPIVAGEITLIEGNDLLTIANWVACGMPEEGGAIAGAGGGGGGGGLGGAGGAGGGL